MTGTITRRPRKTGKPSWGYYFLAGVDEAGKRLQPTKSGFSTKKEAEEALRQAISDFEAKRDAGPAVVLPTFAAFFERWMKEHAGRKCSPKTIERYAELGAYAIRQSVEIAGTVHQFGEVTIDRFGRCRWS